MSRRGDEILESYINGNIGWCRDELKKRDGRKLLEEVYTGLQEYHGQKEADKFRRLMQ